MANLDKKTIQHMATLCRIACSDDEQDALLRDLQQILDYADQLQEVETEGVRPCNHVIEGMCNVWREDSVGKTLSREKFLENSPSHVGGMIRVPPVIDKTES